MMMQISSFNVLLSLLFSYASFISINSLSIEPLIDAISKNSSANQKHDRNIRSNRNLTNNRTIYLEAFKMVTLAMYSLDNNTQSNCAYNIPDSPSDELPQVVKYGIGYEFIKLAEIEYQSEILVTHILVPIVSDIAEEHAKTLDLGRKTSLVRKNRNILKFALLQKFTNIHAVFVCVSNHDSNENIECEIVDRKQNKMVNVYTPIVDQMTLLDVFYYVHYRTKKYQVEKEGGTDVQAGWWFGPNLCSHRRYKMIYGVPFMKSDGMLMLEFNISNIDLNQCDANRPFGTTHKCPQGTKCLSEYNHGFNTGHYNCICTSPLGQEFSFDGNMLEISYLNDSIGKYVCPYTCHSATNCVVTLSRALRVAIIFFQSACICLALLEMAIVFKKRHHKSMKINMWTLTEALLVGGIFIYLSVRLLNLYKPEQHLSIEVVILALDTTILTCLAYSWLREIGFITVYGTLVLRLYKLLAEFQSRKARSVQIKNKDMIRYMLLMILTASFYLLSWTLVNLDHASDPRVAYSLIYYGRTKSGNQFVSCQLRWWDYLVEIAEFIFLCTALRLLYCTKTAPPSEYTERKFIAFAIYLEISISTLCNLTRLGIWRTVHPDALLIIYFLRSHLTITTAILFNMYRRVLCSMCFDGESHIEDVRFKSIQDIGSETDFSQFKICNNGDVSSIAEMDPESIKTELKRLYSQLHYLKTEQMKRCNPHLIRRTNRKKNRRLSVQTLKHKGISSTTAAVIPSTPDIEISQHRTPRESVTSFMTSERTEMT